MVIRRIVSLNFWLSGGTCSPQHAATHLDNRNRIFGCLLEIGHVNIEVIQLVPHRLFKDVPRPLPDGVDTPQISCRI